MKHFKIAQYRFTFIPEDRIVMPETGKGNVIRGAFGTTLRRLCCIDYRTGECNKCGQKNVCAYHIIFNPVDLVKQKRLKKPPRGFIIKPPLETKTVYTPEDPFIFDMVLVGKLIEYIPWVVVPFNELGRNGIGINRGRFTLGGVSIVVDGDTVSLYDRKNPVFKNSDLFITGEEIQKKVRYMQKGRITLEFMTPTRIKFNPEGLRGGSVIVKEPEFHHIIRRLLSRLSALYLAYVDEDVELDYKSIIEKAMSVIKKEADVRWVETKRKSRTEFDRDRRHATHDLSGFIGRITFEGDLEDVLPLILFGEYIHVGEDTTFGNGWYRVIDY
ncbi:MAG: CRISPR system precrRNA processing endoribonuclease RAMP protein Cas6 [Syntrophorhabdaceae bacterium]|nr:CRISPR system precrRNA processing endoribonuclease RAMP protein Cas6 [Syntrophorhabdaceae bacterium]